MNYSVESNATATETLDTGVLDIWTTQPVWSSSDAPHTSCKDLCLETRMLFAMDEKLLKDNLCFNMLQHGKSHLRFHDMDNVQKIKELECYLDTVKMIASPGCSPEVLSMALSLMSSLVQILSAMSVEQYPRASL